MREASPDVGLKKALTAKEGDDIKKKKSLDFMTEEISVKIKQKAILELVEVVKALRIQNAECLAYLENRGLEQYTRMNYAIITGLHIKPHSHTKAVTTGTGGEPDEHDVSFVE